MWLLKNNDVGYLHHHVPTHSVLLFSSILWSGLHCLHHGHLLQLKYKFVFFKFWGRTFLKLKLFSIGNIFAGLEINVTYPL